MSTVTGVTFPPKFQEFWDPTDRLMNLCSGEDARWEELSHEGNEYYFACYVQERQPMRYDWIARRVGSTVIWTFDGVASSWHD